MNNNGTSRVPQWAIPHSPVLIVLLLAGGTPFAAVDSVAHDPRIQTMMDSITDSAVHAFVCGLSGEDSVTIGGTPYLMLTRHMGSVAAVEHATQYVYECLDTLGYTTSYHVWGAAASQRNVVGEKTGTVCPDSIYLMLAHLDDMPDGGVAPGADNNASGCAALMLAAERIADLDFAHTIRFVFSTGHHQGLLGSSAYAEQAYHVGGQIAGVLCFDMIGYATRSDPYVGLHTRTVSSPQYAADSSLAATFVAVVDTYGLGSDISAEVHADGPGTSGASSFWDYGFPGICCMEDHDDFNPYYHTVNDRIEHLNVPYCRAIVRGAFATLCHLAGIVTPTRIAASVPGEMTTEGTRGPAVFHVFGAERRSASARLPFGTVTCDLRGRRVASYAAPGLYFVRADRVR